MLCDKQVVGEKTADNGQPLVSVIVPSYNHEDYIEECILSIVGQTYKNWELIVLDDGSTDGSLKILQQLQEKYPFQLITQKNIGLPKTLNKAITQFAKGKYVAICASDDLWCPDKISLQVEFLEQNPDIPACYGKTYVIDGSGNIDHRTTNIVNENLRGGYVFRDIILMRFHPPVNFMYRRDLFQDPDVGLFDESIHTEDFYMNLRISSKYKIGYIDEFLGNYRIVDGNYRKLRTNKVAMAHLECINRYKSSEYYREAIDLWNLRNFVMYSSIKGMKKFAIGGALRSYKYCFSKDYIKSIVRLALVWR